MHDDEHEKAKRQRLMPPPKAAPVGLLAAQRTAIAEAEAEGLVLEPGSGVSGYKGVELRTGRTGVSGYSAALYRDKRRTHLGTYGTAEEAALVYSRAVAAASRPYSRAAAGAETPSRELASSSSAAAMDPPALTHRATSAATSFGTAEEAQAAFKQRQEVEAEDLSFTCKCASHICSCQQYQSWSPERRRRYRSRMEGLTLQADFVRGHMTVTRLGELIEELTEFMALSHNPEQATQKLAAVELSLLSLADFILTGGLIAPELLTAVLEVGFMSPDLGVSLGVLSSRTAGFRPAVTKAARSGGTSELRDLLARTAVDVKQRGLWDTSVDSTGALEHTATFLVQVATELYDEVHLCEPAFCNQLRAAKSAGSRRLRQYAQHSTATHIAVERPVARAVDAARSGNSSRSTNAGHLSSMTLADTTTSQNLGFLLGGGGVRGPSGPGPLVPPAPPPFKPDDPATGSAATASSRSGFGATCVAAAASFDSAFAHRLRSNTGHTLSTVRGELDVMSAADQSGVVEALRSSLRLIGAGARLEDVCTARAGQSGPGETLDAALTSYPPFGDIDLGTGEPCVRKAIEDGEAAAAGPGPQDDGARRQRSRHAIRARLAAHAEMKAAAAAAAQAAPGHALMVVVSRKMCQNCLASMGVVAKTLKRTIFVLAPGDHCVRIFE